jgi:hypothetical protein
MPAHPLLRFLSTLLLAAAVALAGTPWLDQRAAAQVDAGLQRALVSFAVARTLNAVISVAKGTQLAVEPGGLGMVFAPGQLLAPVDQLVEQFGTVMLAASVALGVQKLLLALGGGSAVAACLSLPACGWLWCLWRGVAVPPWLRSALVGVLLVRFLVPLVSVGNEALFQAMLPPTYDSSYAAVNGSTQALKSDAQPVSASGPDAPPATASAPAPAAGPWWQRLKDRVTSAQAGLSVQPAFTAMQARAEARVEHVVTLLAVFVLQTVLMPRVLVWLLWRGLLLGVRRVAQPVV